MSNPNELDDPFARLIGEATQQEKNRKLLGKNATQKKLLKKQKKEDEATRLRLHALSLQHKLIIAQIAESRWRNVCYVLYEIENTCPYCEAVDYFPCGIHLEQQYQGTETRRSRELPNFELPDNNKLPRVVRTWKETKLPCSPCFRTAYGQGTEAHFNQVLAGQHLRALTEEYQTLTTKTESRTEPVTYRTVEELINADNR